MQFIRKSVKRLQALSLRKKIMIFTVALNLLALICTSYILYNRYYGWNLKNVGNNVNQYNILIANQADNIINNADALLMDIYASPAINANLAELDRLYQSGVPTTDFNHAAAVNLTVD